MSLSLSLEFNRLETQARLRRASETCTADALGLQTGDRVRYVVLESEVRIIKVRSIGRLYGVLQHHGPAVTLEELECAIKARAIEA